MGVLLARSAFPAAKDRFEERLRLIADLQHGLKGREVDVVILNDAPPMLGRHIVTRGTRIACMDPESDLEFVRIIQSRASDLEPFLRRMKKIKLAALAGR